MVLIQDCPVSCRINLKDNVIKKSKNILIKEGLRKAIEAVNTVKINIFFLNYIT